MNQNEIIKSAISGDKEAFRMLISILRPTIEKTVFGMLGQCPEAEDIGQETFIKLYHSLDKFRFESNLKTYVTRIAINLSLNELKKRKRRTNLFESNVNITEISNNIEFDNQTEFMDRIKWALKKLSNKHRPVIVLRFIDGYSLKETAEILEIPVGTVLSRTSRALQYLKDIINMENINEKY